MSIYRYRLPLLVAFTLAMLLPAAVELTSAWRNHPDYSHGWLVAPVGAFLLWDVLRRTAPTVPSPTLGMVEILLGGLLLAAFQVLPWGLLGFGGFAILLRGLLLTLGGNGWANASVLPTLFLGFLFPLPVVWTDATAIWLQQQVAIASAAVLNLASVCVRRGTTLFLAGLPEPVVVAEACSGLRQVLAFFGLALLLGCLLRRPKWQVLLLVVLAVPVALATNLVRVLVMVAIASYCGSEWITGWLHDLPAAMTLPLGAACFFLVLTLLPRADKLSIEKKGSLPLPSISLVSMMLTLALAQGLLMWHLASSAMATPGNLRASLNSLPRELAAAELIWQSWPTELDAKRRQQLAFADEFLHRQYRDERGNSPFQLYLCFSRLGLDRQHHPEVCLVKVGGATELVHARRSLPLGFGTAQRQLFLQGSGAPVLVYYWHYTLPSEASASALSPLQTLHQKVRQRPASLTVQLSTTTPLSRMELLEADLLSALHRQMEPLLPPGSRLGSDRLAVRLVHLP